MLWWERFTEPWLRSLRISAASSLLLVATAPPSPKQPRFFWMMKLRQTASLSSPMAKLSPRGANALGAIFHDK